MGPTGIGVSAEERNLRRLTQQKLGENLMGASKALEAASLAYESTEKERLRRDAAAAASAAPAVDGGGSHVELAGMEAEDRQQTMQLQEVDLTEAEADVHAAIVQEY